MQLVHNRKELVAGIGLLVFVLGGNAWIGLQQTQRLQQNWIAVSHTQEALEYLSRLSSTIREAESGQRGFIVTEDEAYLEPYEDARHGVLRLVDTTAQLLADNPEQATRLQALDAQIKVRLAELDRNLQISREQGFDAARTAIRSGHGYRTMKSIADGIWELQQEERAILRLREHENEEAYHSLLMSTLLSVLLGLGAVLALLWLLRRYITAIGKSTSIIHEHRELLHAMLISIGDGVIATDRAGRVTLLNNVAQQLTGWTDDEARGLPLETVFNIIHEETRQAIDNPARRALEEGCIVGLANHALLISRNGVEWPIDDSASPVRNQQDEIAGAIVVFREISNRKRHEEELRRQALALQEQDRRKDEFLATLAHELRNPLSPLSNALQVWPMVESDRQQSDQLRQMMMRQVSQMTRLIDDLLDVARITRGKIELRRQPADLGQLIAGAVEAVQPQLTDGGHQLTVDMPSEPIIVDGDVARLTQVFGNILNNAAKYTGRGGKIQIRAERQGQEAVVSISDNGPGIPAPMLGKIFEMFQQVDQTLERAHGGLGIGLTLVKRLVELHGGRVEARSEGPGKGSTILVTLPIPANAAYAVEPTAPTIDGQSTPIPAHKILVVDDVQASARTLALMLQSIGQTVSIVHDGPAAIDWVREHRPDLVFLDIAMPGMSGYEVARRIRKQAELRESYLVALTGYGQEADRLRALEAGFDCHMTKPTSIDALRRLLTDRAAEQQGDHATASAAK